MNAIISSILKSIISEFRLILLDHITNILTILGFYLHVRPHEVSLAWNLYWGIKRIIQLYSVIKSWYKSNLWIASLQPYTKVTAILLNPNYHYIVIRIRQDNAFWSNTIWHSVSFITHDAINLPWLSIMEWLTLGYAL